MNNHRRTYATCSKGKKVLVTWYQARCDKCQRFLSKIQRKYCLNCGKEAKKETKANWEKVHDVELGEQKALRCKVYRNAERFNIGDLV